MSDRKKKKLLTIPKVKFRFSGLKNFWKHSHFDKCVLMKKNRSWYVYMRLVDFTKKRGFKWVFELEFGPSSSNETVSFDQKYGKKLFWILDLHISNRFKNHLSVSPTDLLRSIRKFWSLYSNSATQKTFSLILKMIRKRFRIFDHDFTVLRMAPKFNDFQVFTCVKISARLSHPCALYRVNNLLRTGDGDGDGDIVPQTNMPWNLLKRIY